ncbi:hypothetical protein [Streptomyces chrestomyceticus]|uniref:hypothetical protein n=1 Tax=Streptomyces chrestomyceticus TaxID=68185 RepID=UPI0019D075D7|nr:hypothetical protein [Streptomyces chrestomyceticus]
MFDLKAEAEMRLFSEKLARELAGKRPGAREDADDRATGEPSTAEELSTTGRQPPDAADGPDAAGAPDVTEIPGAAQA